MNVKEFAKFVKKETKDEYELLDKENIECDVEKKLLMLHKKCGKTYYVNIHRFKQGSRCPHCAKNKKYTIDTFKEKVKEKYGEEYSVLSTEYKNNKTPIKMKHNVCGHEWIVIPNYFIKNKGTRCPKCFPMKVRKTQKEFDEEIKKLVGNEYTFLENYIKNNEKILVRHNCEVCNNYEYKVKPVDFISGSNRCPKCNLLSKESKGIKIIKKILNENQIIFETEYPLKNEKKKKGERLLKYDIFIPSIKMAIEFDGSQHYGVKFGNDEKELKNQIKRDKRKDKYSKENNISLIRIPYYEEKNIEEILKKEVLKFND